jgi:hypothetical protein
MTWDFLKTPLVFKEAQILKKPKANSNILPIYFHNVTKGMEHHYELGRVLSKVIEEQELGFMTGMKLQWMAVTAPYLCTDTMQRICLKESCLF